MQMDNLESRVALECKEGQYELEDKNILNPLNHIPKLTWNL